MITAMRLPVVPKQYKNNLTLKTQSYMFIVTDYPLAVICCFVTMICWGSWGNTQKLAGKSWRYELFYWDYVLGIFLFSLLLAFTLGSYGAAGRPFTADLAQVETGCLLSALFGGVLFNVSNILLSASVSLSGMAVAFPLGVGLALVSGVFINYIEAPKGNAVWLFTGVMLIALAIVCNGVAAGKKRKSGTPGNRKSIGLAAVAGILMAFFYRFVAAAMDLNDFEHPAAGMATPYTAFFIFSGGILLSNFVFDTWVMKHPFTEAPVGYRTYFAGKFQTHLVGIAGGCIWGLGTALNYLAAGKAGAAVSYALGQGAPMIAAAWGVWVWKEFAGSSRSTGRWLACMFILFVAGLAAIVAAGSN